MLPTSMMIFASYSNLGCIVCLLAHTTGLCVGACEHQSPKDHHSIVYEVVLVNARGLCKKNNENISLPCAAKAPMLHAWLSPF